MAKGRPRTDSIPRFNVDTYLSSNRKYILFKRKLKLDDAKTYLTLVRFFNYINANCAITGNLQNVHAESLAEFCFWEKDASELWKTLCEVGFIEGNGDIHDQEIHQPLAAEIKRKRKTDDENLPQDEQKQEKANLGGNNRTEVDSNPQPITYNLEPITNNLKPETNPEEKPLRGSGAAEPPVSEELFQNPANELVTKILKKQKSRTEKIGPMRHLFGKIYDWCGITEPIPEVHDKALFVLFGAIQENGMERLIDDFRDRNYNPNKDPQARFEAYIAAGWSERNKTKPKPNGKVVQWCGPE